MKIVVCVKQVPDTSEVRIDPITNNLIRKGVPSILNPFDYTALAKALELKEKNGGTVTVLSMGLPQVEAELQKCLNMGADRAILLTDRRFGGADTLATGYALSKAIERLDCDLILCGNEAIDGCTGQVGPIIGEFLKIPSFSYVSRLAVEGKKLTVTRRTEKTEDTYETELPALAAVLKENTILPEGESPFTVEQWNADGFEEERIGSSGSPTRVVSVKVSEREKNYLEVDASWDLETRMEYIFNGGLPVKDTPLIRGNVTELSEQLLTEGGLL